jgi:uncharacterized lipoprotein YajG
MICQECGMACEPGEYHPYAACLMFKGCHNGDTVRDNLDGAARAAREAALEECCAAIKAEDDRMADEDYMLDSDDCIRVIRALRQQEGS